MRLRVALPVALVIFVALILLVICSGLNIAENKNESLKAELQGICEVVGATTNSAASRADGSGFRRTI